MKLNKTRMTKVIIFLGIGLITLGAYRSQGSKRNELKYMKSGFDDPIVNEIYYLEKQDVEKLTNVEMKLEYADVDLNDDGLDDKLIIIASPLHSGSHGDTFEILLNNNGTYNKIFGATLRLYSVKWEAIGSIVVLDETSNGLKNIEIESGQGAMIIQYDGNRYR